MRIGKVAIYNKRHYNLFVQAKIKDGELSISGVIGPLQSGNAMGGCGQIDMEFDHRNPADNDKRTTRPYKANEIIYAPGWNANKWLDLLDVWDRWHLNKMNAACTHQRKNWDIKKEVIIVTYNLNNETLTLQNKIKADAMERLEITGTATLTPDEQKIVILKWQIKRGSEFPLTDDEALHYVEKSRETKSINWLTQADHPDGILSKTCEICGYKYGSAWLKEELPESVYKFLVSLPDTDMTPAWV